MIIWFRVRSLLLRLSDATRLPPDFLGSLPPRKPRSPYSAELTSPPAANSRLAPISHSDDRSRAAAIASGGIFADLEQVCGEKVKSLWSGKGRREGSSSSLALCPLHSIIHTFCGRHSGVRVGPEWQTRGGRGGTFSMRSEHNLAVSFLQRRRRQSAQYSGLSANFNNPNGCA